MEKSTLAKYLLRWEHCQYRLFQPENRVSGWQDLTSTTYSDALDYVFPLTTQRW